MLILSIIFLVIAAAALAWAWCLSDRAADDLELAMTRLTEAIDLNEKTQKLLRGESTDT